MLFLTFSASIKRNLAYKSSIFVASLFTLSLVKLLLAVAHAAVTSSTDLSN